MPKLPVASERYRTEIDAELRSVLAERQSPLYDMMRYHLGWIDENGIPQEGLVGKALRPTLCLLVCEAVGGEYQRALPAAAAIELVHNYSLIHDDIQDGDRERRHRPTVWSVWGKPQAINAGTAMRILANSALLRLEDRGVPSEKQLRVQRLLDETSLTLIEGQYLDISYESRSDIGVSDYLRMIEAKTASLIACAMEIGAFLGTDDDKLIESLWSVGKRLGLSFQIKDDLLGIWGDEEELGKPLANDIRRGKKTFPVAYALEKAQGELRKELANIYRDGAIDDGSVAAVQRILEATGARITAQEMAEGFCQEASQVIDRLALVPSDKQDLQKLVSFMLERSF